MARYLLVLCVAVMALASARGEQGLSSKPNSPQPNDKKDVAESLSAKVVSVSGAVQKCDANVPDAKWLPVQAGETLTERTLIRTGLGAKLVLRFSDRGEVQVKSGTKIGIRHCRKEGDVARMGVGLKYGAVKAKVNRAAGPNDFRIHTPVATLSVRGSAGAASYSAGFGMQFHSQQSTWNIHTNQGSKGVSQGGSTDGNLTPTQELSARKNDSQKSDPFGLSGNEAKNVRDNANPSDPFNPVGGTNGAGLNTNPGLAQSVSRDIPIPIPDGPGASCPSPGCP